MAKLLRLSGLVCLCATAAATAAEFDSEIELGIVRTDNLTLATTDPEAATVWQLIPSFNVTQESPRLSADAALRIEAYHYDQRSENEVFNQFDGELSLALLPERFFLNVGGSRSQAVVDPEAAIPVNNFVVSTNRVDLDEYYTGPSFSFPVGGNAVVDGDLRRTWVGYADSLAAGAQEDYDEDTGTLSVDNYRKRMGFTWAARYNYEHTEYELQLVPYEHRDASVELGFWASGSTRVFASGGKETPWDEPLNTGLEDRFWEVGFSRAVTEGLNAELAFGERSFGSSLRGELDYDFGRGSTALTYNEDPTTTSADRYTRGGLLDPDEPLDYLFRAGSIERYISKRLQWNLNLELQRTGIVFTVFDETREDRSTIEGTPLPEEAQSGGNLAFTWKLGARLELVLSGSTAEREFADAASSDLKMSSLAANYQLGARTRLTVRLDDWKEESATAGAVNYRAKLVSAVVARAFR